MSIASARSRVLRQARPMTGAPADRLRAWVDVSVIAREDARTGIQRVVREVVRHAAQLPLDDLRLDLVSATERSPYRRATWSPSAEGAPTRTTTDSECRFVPQCGDVFVALDFAPRVLPRHWAELLTWKRLGVSLQFILYDMLPLRHPEWFRPRATKHFRNWLMTVSVLADAIHCISNTVALDLRRWLAESGLSQEDGPRVTSFRLGADFSDGPRKSSSARGQVDAQLVCLHEAPTALMVGTIEPRKGYRETLDAFEAAWSSGASINLLIVGRAGWCTEALQQAIREHPLFGRRLFWIEEADDLTLAKAYEGAAGVLVASMGEGFGLPLLEAARFGKPVLARDLPVFREVADSTTTYFGSDGAPLSAQNLTRWFTGLASTRSPRAARVHTWRETAAELFANVRDIRQAQAAIASATEA